jgi:hypothetical protein
MVQVYGSQGKPHMKFSEKIPIFHHVCWLTKPL